MKLYVSLLLLCLFATACATIKLTDVQLKEYMQICLVKTRLSQVLRVLANHINVKKTQITDQQNLDWWKTAVIYQVYPRSFKDSDDDGIGDLNGIINKLEHLNDTGVNVLWLSPIYSSPGKDFGYDVSNFTDISPIFGTLSDFDTLVAKAKILGMKIMMDFIPNHTSDEHEWFKKSVDGIKPYDDYYIWRNAKKGPKGERIPPNNWISFFGGSAWKWNEKRQQYFYHAFQTVQPDLNYHNPKVQQEIQDVLTFWMDRGVDGFRVDAIATLYEDSRLLDEPKLPPNITNLALPSDFIALDHIYTQHLKETFSELGLWISLLNSYAKNKKTDAKVMIIEDYTSITNLKKYYNEGAISFNFAFCSNLTNSSTAAEFKDIITTWLNAVPEGKPINWVVGNHDNPRTASRFGFNSNRADQISLLSGVLPGSLVVYYGDEIGMVNRFFTYEETIDPIGRVLGPDRYNETSRDPVRTPFQWDNTTNAGFSNAAKTWLPVNPNYKTLNLAAQKEASESHFKIFQALTKLRKTPTLQQGRVEVLLPNEKILAVVRRLENSPTIALLINFDYTPVTLDAKTSLNIDEILTIQIASLSSGLTAGSTVNTTNIVLPGAATIILS